MRLWRKALGALKDHNSIWITGLTRRTGLRNPEIEATVIRATSHDEFSIDRRNIDRACEWVRISPFHLKPFLWSVAHRMEKTRSWIVALKGLYLMHNFINSNVSCIRRMGRLPFDLSNFKDGHSFELKAWPFEAFIRAYYAFLDQKSTLIFQYAEAKKDDKSSAIKHELCLVQKLQGLIDLLMQIKPQGRATYTPLVLDVLDGLTIEINNNFNRVCRGIAIVLMNIYSGTKEDAEMALSVVRRAAVQGEEIAYYLEFCRDIGVLKGSTKFSFADRIPEEGIKELEQIVNDFSTGSNPDQENQEKGMIVREVDDDDQEKMDKLENEFRTIITDNWEKFDDDFVQTNPFASPLTKYIEYKPQDLPDLIIL